MLLEGTTVCPGIAMGPVHLKGYDLDQIRVSRIPADRVEAELNRFRDGIRTSTTQIEELKHKLEGQIGPQEARILDTHLAYLRDPVLVADVENLIINERSNLEGAIMKVIGDFDRIFQLVENQLLKERASDLRDVGMRVLRNLAAPPDARPAPPPPQGKYVLAARQLSIVDMFNLENERVEGILAEEGGLTSHAAILARSMRIPTVSGIPDLAGKLREGDFVILDASSGQVRVNPDDRVRREYAVTARVPVATPGEDEEKSALQDGTAVNLMAACGNLGEVTQATEAGMSGIGLFRTELLFIVEKYGPSEDMLVRQYAEAVKRAGALPIRFRLLDVGSDVQVAGMPKLDEKNPALGLRSIRALLREPRVLRLQLRAILRAGAQAGVSIAIPFVTGVADVKRVRMALLEERQALLKQGHACADHVPVNAMIEVPAAALSLASILREADAAVVSWDDLLQYVLAADRDNPQVRDYYEAFHPAVFDLLARMAADAEREEKELILFGEGATDPLRLPFYIGAGIRTLAIAPVRARTARKLLSRWTLTECEALAEKVLDANTALDVQRILLNAER